MAKKKIAATYTGIHLIDVPISKYTMNIILHLLAKRQLSKYGGIQVDMPRSTERQFDLNDIFCYKYKFYVYREINIPFLFS